MRDVEAVTPTPHAFLFADLVGFTALTAAHGDERGADVATRFHRAVRGLLPAEPAAAELKSLGDGLMIRCEDPAGAVRLGVAITETVEALADVPPVRVGVHAGPAVHRDGDWYGTTVNVASRLCDAADAGEVLVSDQAVALAGAPHGIDFGDLRLHRLKHLDAPVPARPAQVAAAPLPVARPERRAQRWIRELLCPFRHTIQGAH